MRLTQTEDHAQWAGEYQRKSAKMRRLKRVWSDVLKTVRSILEPVQDAKNEPERPVNRAGVEATLATRGNVAMQSTNPSEAAKRAIRLKEFPKSTEITHTPPEWYLAACNPSLVKQPYKNSDG